KYAQEKYRVHLELTTVLIPGVNDSVTQLTKMATWIVKNLGPQTPWHLSAFCPQLAPDKLFQKIPAPTKKQLQAAAKIGQAQGLKHVYIWAPALGFSQTETLCPHCQEVLVTRNGWQPKLINLTPKVTCRNCHKKVNFVLK
ncbi:hypothetical protein MUP65_01495, partial [Patescibacteria group bacterium]|nr:hypothetical protein [Patescibacteria group bacterium]